VKIEVVATTCRPPAPQFQPDQEQEHRHAELGEIVELGRLADHRAQARASDDDAGDEIANDRPDPAASSKRRGYRRRGKKYNELRERAIHAAVCSIVKSCDAGKGRGIKRGLRWASHP
jgi:hypothetical protein